MPTVLIRYRSTRPTRSAKVADSGVKDNRCRLIQHSRAKTLIKLGGGWTSAGGVLLRNAQRRWMILGAAGRVLVVVVALCGLIGYISCFRVSDSGVPVTVGGPTSFAVLINTYKRPDMLRGAVQHYAQTCGRDFGVGNVFIIWAEVGKQPPRSYDLLASSPPLRKRMNGGEVISRANITVIPVDKDSLNSRFLPIDGLSEESVFVVDDDVRVACTSLLTGFKAWQTNPFAMVGYYPRLASPPLFGGTISGKLVYHTWPIVYLRNKFSMVLTKACFLHKRYLDLYSGSAHPQEIRDYVDVHKNCEDVAMALLVANVTKAQKSHPVYVQGSISDKGLFSGISTGGGHFGTRSDCLTELTKTYREKGWSYPLVDVPLMSSSHAFPGSWLLQAKPSNFFEWLAFGNTLS